MKGKNLAIAILLMAVVGLGLAVFWQKQKRADQAGTKAKVRDVGSVQTAKEVISPREKALSAKRVKPVSRRKEAPTAIKFKLSLVGRKAELDREIAEKEKQLQKRREEVR